MIHVRDLRIDYDNVCAVRDLSLDIGAGEVCGLIGPNGAGKTSTMRALLGLLEPTYGEIEMAGVDIREHPGDANRVIGFMPDFPPMYDDLMCWEFLDLFAASYGVPKRDRQALIDEKLELVGLTEKKNAFITGLSRGMRQRLMLAKTLLPEPRILILDEPVSGVDPQGRIDFKNVLKLLAAEGRTIVISSHILAEMSEFCTSVAIMERGRMVVNGRIDEINARLMGDTVLTVEVLSDPAAFKELVSRDPLAGPVETSGRKHQFRYSGTVEQSSDLLCNLVLAGVKVAAFAPKRENLEELFLKVGAKELA